MQDFVVVAVLKDHIEDDQMYEAILITEIKNTFQYNYFSFLYHKNGSLLSIKGKPEYRGAWWLIGRVDTYRPKGCGFNSRSSRHVGT